MGQIDRGTSGRQRREAAAHLARSLVCDALDRDLLSTHRFRSVALRGPLYSISSISNAIFLHFRFTIFMFSYKIVTTSISTFYFEKMPRSIQNY